MANPRTFLPPDMQQRLHVPQSRIPSLSSTRHLDPGVSPEQHPRSFLSNEGASYTMSWAEKVYEPDSSTRLWKEGDPYRYAPKRRGDPWEQCMKRVDNYDDEMSRGWKEDIDTLLVFAGLFSASSTAFLIESYHWLQDDPGDLTVQLLSQVTVLIANSTNQPIPSLNAHLFSDTPTAVRINTVWFLSLLLSLATVSLGILCKQWLREYRRDTPTSSPKETLELRQIRYESFEKWHIPILLSAMPLLLQLALVLFFAGVLDLLWSLNYIVASFCTAVVAASVFILVWTTVVPAYYLIKCPDMIFSDDVPLCPYKSPQAWLFYQLVLLLPFKKLKRRTYFANWAMGDLHILRNHFPSTQINARTHLLRGLRWMIALFSDSTAMASNIFHCLQSFSIEVAAIATGQSGETSKDVIFYNFFRNSSWDPDTGRFLAELFIRQLNGPSRTSGVGDALGSFWNLAYLNLIEDDPQNGLPNELLRQIIASVQNYIVDDRITLLDMSPLLMICQQLWKHPIQSVREHSTVLLDEFERWLTSAEGDIQLAFMPHLASALTEIIYAENDRSPISVLICSDRGPRFIRILNELMATRGIDMDGYSLQDMPMSWEDAKIKVVRLSGLSHEYFDVLKFPPTSPVQDAETEYDLQVDTATESFQQVPSVLSGDSMPKLG
ncbi:hypothetical protein D9758_011349 [Tetrapyrgos nigripes]|uniref:DUF6535 domain-containing protein n=1 Tax=Tetrapyrgos nigripes TaxID=182062 RepID=A0A8H5G884_9AGAR|nr:hypothetical protein D9758_011349 [Tetrapyrgos nigripes]